jgi:5-methylcytosine-specific restriction protein A
MAYDHQLSQGDVIDNKRLCSIFSCGPQGGMRRSLKTNTLVIVSDHIRSAYQDRWYGDVLHYTGMGLRGDQTLEGKQNRTLNESSSNSVDVFLFEVFQERAYTFQDQVVLGAEPYQERQPDVDGNDRQVWMFPLHLLGGGQGLEISAAELSAVETRRTRRARRKSDEELTQQASNAPKQAGQRRTSATQYQRSEAISEYTKRRANGHCDLCGQPAPFEDREGRPFLESHHIEWLARGGEDSISNTVALCPNCHRKMHSLNHTSDKVHLREIAERKL